MDIFKSLAMSSYWSFERKVYCISYSVTHFFEYTIYNVLKYLILPKIWFMDGSIAVDKESLYDLNSVNKKLNSVILVEWLQEAIDNTDVCELVEIQTVYKHILCNLM